MTFSSITFLGLFLPVVLLGSCILRDKVRNYWLFLASVIFYSWGGLAYTIVLLLSTIVNYGCGFLVDSSWVAQKKLRKIFLIVAILFNLGVLAFFKYFNFVVENIVNAWSFLHIEMAFDVPVVPLPIGISFFTFQILSYIIDVYRGEARAQKNPAYLGMYIFLFPQLIAGPIVRYTQIEEEILHPKVSAIWFREGFIRFTVGLGKKVLIANAMGALADKAFNNPAQLDFPMAWVGMFAYTLQIYYDFSAYSDMAIGIGRCLGFTFPENFNYPYISGSVKEFWRRWHVSLSTWFRDYLYIPLGGNRQGTAKTYRNLLIVFFLTGLWHGAAWTFVVWGLYHGCFLLLERGPFGKVLKKSGAVFQHIYTMLVVMIGWVFFRSDSIATACSYIGKLVSFGSANWPRLLQTVTHSQWVYLVLGIVFSAPLMGRFKQLMENWKAHGKGTAVVITLLQDGAVIGLMTLSICCLAGSDFNPFIYFIF